MIRKDSNELAPIGKIFLAMQGVTVFYHYVWFFLEYYLPYHFAVGIWWTIVAAWSWVTVKWLQVKDSNSQK